MRQKNTRTTAAITADILAIQNPVAGTLTEIQRPSKGGKTRPHFHLQRWVDGKNQTSYVPAEKAAAVREGIARFKRLGELMNELAAAGATDILCGAAEDPAKKKRLK